MNSWSWVKEKINWRYIKANENRNTTYQNPQEATKKEFKSEVLNDKHLSKFYIYKRMISQK